MNVLFVQVPNRDGELYESLIFYLDSRNVKTE